MNNHYQAYKEKNKSEINDLLDNSNELTLEAKLGLQKIVEENSTKFDTSQINHLQQEIEKDRASIKSLKKLNWLGIDLYEEKGALTIRKSRSANIRDFFGILIGTLLSTGLFVSFVFWRDIIVNEIGVFNLLMAVLLSIIGLYGFSLIFKTIDRIYFYRYFLISKTINDIVVNIHTKQGLEIHSLSTDSKLEITINGNGIILAIKDHSKKIELIKFKKLGFELQKVLAAFTEKFNNG